jgi:hypothetical protein
MWRPARRQGPGGSMKYQFVYLNVVAVYIASSKSEGFFSVSLDDFRPKRMAFAEIRHEPCGSEK